MKSCTDIEQSKKLAKILPTESADMYHFVPADNEGEFIEKVEVIGHKSCYNLFYKVTDWDDTPYIPCWSLAALFGILPILNNRPPVISKKSDGKYRVCYNPTALEKIIMPDYYDNPIDACYEMIIKLHELNLL